MTLKSKKRLLSTSYHAEMQKEYEIHKRKKNRANARLMHTEQKLQLNQRNWTLLRLMT